MQPQQVQQNIDLQYAIQELLKTGLSYLQVWIKINACKQLFKKNTPEFYSCLGINPPQNTQKQQPQPQPRPQPQPQPKPQPQPQPRPQPQPQPRPQQTSQQSRQLIGITGAAVAIAAVVAIITLLLINRRDRK